MHGRRPRRKRRFPFIAFILCIVAAMFLGTVMFTSGDSWINGTGYIYPNNSWSDNVNITTGTLMVQGQFVCLADGSNCPASFGPSAGNGTIIETAECDNGCTTITEAEYS